MKPCYIGVDIGGTKIAAALVDDDGHVMDRRHRATPRSGGAAVLDAVTDLVAAFPQAEGIGVGSPGVIDPRTGTVVAATAVLPGWSGTTVGTELTRRTGLPAAVDNDVRAMARGEATHGAGAAYQDALFVSVGTGVGGAVMRNRRLEEGTHGTTGEIAHLLVPTAGPHRCGCGRQDHLEAMASGPAIAAAYRLQTGHGHVDLPDIALRARTGDNIAAEVIATTAVLLGRVLAGLVCALDLQVVVLGGGVAQIGRPFVDPLAAAFREELALPLTDVAIRPAALGTDAALVGAAMLARSLTGARP